MLFKIFRISFFAFLLLIVVLLFNTFRFNSKQKDFAKIDVPELPLEAIIHFQKAIQFQTISNADSTQFDSTQFLGFRAFLENTYPLIKKQLKREIVDKYSLLYEWKGKNTALKPIILMAHQDVVPIEKESANMWTVDPFAGTIKEGYIWGRGTVDDKNALIEIFESVEKLLGKKFQPERTLYLSFGHNEEVLGTGAKAIAQLLENRKIKSEFVLDEGGIITTDKIPDMNGKPVAVIGTAEKGYISVELSAVKNGGHSSMIEAETALDMITKAVVKLRENPFPPDFSQSTKDFFDHVGPEMPFFKKIVFANTWLFKPLIIKILKKTGSGNAMVRTTTAPTILHSGIKDNVVPTVATAVVNFRILPGSTSADVLEDIKNVINNDQVKIKKIGNVSEPSLVSETESIGFERIMQSVKQVFGSKIIVSPYLVLGGTDSRNFEKVAENIFRFSPTQNPIGFHGIDERMSLNDYKKGVAFYEQLIKGF